MDFQHAVHSRGLLERVRQFARRHVEPVEELYYELVKPEVPLQDASCLTRIEGVGARAGLVESVPVGAHGGSLTNLEYAPVEGNHRARALVA